MKTTSNKGFTLLEMLVVVLIIVLLAGLVFRLVGAIGKSNDIAETRAKIEKVSHALEEFKAIYGKYPPVPFYQGRQQMGYEFPTEITWGENSEAMARRIVDGNHAKLSDWGGHCTVYTFGLASFFIPRYNGTAERGPKAFCAVKNNRRYNAEDYGDGEAQCYQWTVFNSTVNGRVGDSERDLNAVRRILPCLGGKLGADNRIADSGCLSYWESHRAHPFNENAVVTNLNITFADAWRRELRYVSMPPYETYKLWSNGPDGIEGNSDDIVSGTN